MPILETRTLHWPDEAACEAFARQLAAHAGLRDAFIELHGPLGAGKTVNLPGSGLQSPGQVSSPLKAKPAGTPTSGGHDAGSGHKPAVTQVIRDGERITHIEVRCSCGEVITLECGY